QSETTREDRSMFRLKNRASCAHYFSIDLIRHFSAETKSRRGQPNVPNLLNSTTTPKETTS
ncbi:MAG: hypothetical protein IIU08_07565, partial [Clostridia bacterium]|nr:hypothetical protein [Clostridia bacterium]